MLRYNLYGVVLAIPREYPDGLFDPWLYKLDPFKLLSNSAFSLPDGREEADIILNRWPADMEEPATGACIFREQAGLFDRCIFRCDFAAEESNGRIPSVADFAAEKGNGRIPSVADFAAEESNGRIPPVADFATEKGNGRIPSVADFAAEEGDFSKSSALESQKNSEGAPSPSAHGTIWSYIRRRSGEVYLQYYVTPDCRNIYLMKDETNTGGVMAFEFLNLIIPSCILGHHMLTFHSALIEDEGEGILIMAPSGTGKTTHARLWRDHRGSLILNGDRAVCYPDPVTGQMMVCSFPWSGTSGEQIRRKVPLKAAVILKRSATNQATRLSPLAALGPVMENTLLPRYDENLTSTAIDLLDHWLEQVPVYTLQCRPDPEAVEVLQEAIRGK